MESRFFPTVIYANPNACYYESIYYRSEWLDFYINNGINLFVYNYRGYARSEGQPDPDTMLTDGDSIVEYLRHQL